MTLFVPHAVEALLNSHHTQHLSSSRLAKIETQLMTRPQVTIKRLNVLNPAEFLETIPRFEIDQFENDREPDPSNHDCITILDHLLTPRADLQETPILDADLTVFTDGSCLRNSEGQAVAGYGITTVTEVLELGPLPWANSAQQAELEAVSRACELGRGLKINIYTDSRYAFGVPHDFGMLWKQRGFLTSPGQPIKNSKQVSRLLECFLLPRKVAVIKTTGHSRESTPEAEGNQLADQAAREAALLPPVPVMISCTPLLAPPPIDLVALTEAQALISPETARQWELQGCTRDSETGLWKHGQQVVLPPQLHRPLLSHLHHLSHWGPDKLYELASQHWWGISKKVVEEVVSGCQSCPLYNPSKSLRPPRGCFPLPLSPF